MKRILAFIVFLFSSYNISEGQQILRTLTLSSEFTNIPGTPRVIATNPNTWVAIWRQNSTPAAIRGRLIRSTGSTQPSKIVATTPSFSVHSFDIAFNPVNKTYVLVYESPQGLVTQLLSSNLVRVGSTNLIEAGAIQTVPRILFDAVTQKYVIYWLSSHDGIARKVLKSRVADSRGGMFSSERIVREASGHYEFLSISSNILMEQVMALLMEVNGTSAAVVGINLKLDGTSTGSPIRVFQSFTNGLRSFGDLDFSTASGTGMVFWTDKEITKIRLIKKNGSLAPSTRRLNGTSDQFSTQPAITYNAAQNLFLGSWSFGNQVLAVMINPNTAAVVQQQFSVATSLLGNSGNLGAAYDPISTNIILVWDDFAVEASSTRFLVRAAVISNNP
jgi:hypothetical protein